MIQWKAMVISSALITLEACFLEKEVPGQLDNGHLPASRQLTIKMISCVA